MTISVTSFQIFYLVISYYTLLTHLPHAHHDAHQDLSLSLSWTLIKLLEGWDLVNECQNSYGLFMPWNIRLTQ